MLVDESLSTQRQVAGIVLDVRLFSDKHRRVNANVVLAEENLVVFIVEIINPVQILAAPQNIARSSFKNAGDGHCETLSQSFPPSLSFQTFCVGIFRQRDGEP